MAAISAKRAQAAAAVAAMTDQKPSEARNTVAPSSAGDKVVMACNHPNGIRMRLFEPHEVRSSGPSGQQFQETIHYPSANAPEVVLNGPATRFGEAPVFVIAGGYALTAGVDKDFAEEWMKQNRDSELVRNKIVFVQRDENSARDQARDQADVRSGLEPLDMRMKATTTPDGDVVRRPRDPRLPRTNNPNIPDGIQPAEGRPKN